MFVIGGLVMDWRISHGFAGWSEVGRELAPDWQHSYSIVRMFFTDWQRIDIELADWSWIDKIAGDHWIGVRFMNWWSGVKLT